MIQLAQPEGLAAEGGRETEDLTASHFPLAPGKPKQRSAEIKKQRGINNKEGEETGSEKGRGRGRVGPSLVFKKVIFHFRRNRFPLSGPLHIQNRVSLLVTGTGSVCLFFLSLFLFLVKLAYLPVNSGQRKRDRFTFTHTEICKVLLVETEVCFGPTAL